MLPVAFILPHLKVERYQKEKLFFEAKIKELGGTCVFASSDNDQQLQLKQAKDFLEQGIKVLVLSPVNSNLAGEIVRMAHDYHAIVISYDRLILNADVDYIVTFRYTKIGQDMVNYCTKLRPNGKYMIIGGDKTDFNALQIDKGERSVLDPLENSGQIKRIYTSYIEEWDQRMLIMLWQSF